MIKVIEIKYKKTFIKVSLDTGEVLNLTYEMFKMYSINRGKIVDSIEYQQLKEESERFNCKQKALNYLAMGNKSSLEMETYLIKKGFTKGIIVEAVAGLKNSGYINDYDYALWFIKNKMRGKIIGLNLLKRDLFKKGISREIIKKVISETEAGNIEIDDIYELAIKKMNRLENKKNKMAKMIYFLKQKGFRENEVRTVIDRLKNNGHEF